MVATLVPFEFLGALRCFHGESYLKVLPLQKIVVAGAGLKCPHVILNLLRSEKLKARRTCHVLRVCLAGRSKQRPIGNRETSSRTRRYGAQEFAAVGILQDNTGHASLLEMGKRFVRNSISAAFDSASRRQLLCKLP